VRRLVLLVGAIVLVDMLFYGAITPLLPELSRELGLGKNAAGVLTGAYAAGTLLGSLPAGWLTARFGVRPTVVVGMALMGVSSLAFAFADDILMLDAARFLQGVGSACSWAAGMAWLAAGAPPERRGEVLGTAMGVAIFGVQLGPVLGAVATWTGREVAFSSAVLLGVVLAGLAWATPGPAAAAPAPASPAAALRDRSILKGMWLTALGGAGLGLVNVLEPLRLDALGAGALVVGATFFAAGGMEALVNPVVGRLTDRSGMRVLVPAALLACAVALVVLRLPGTVLGVAIAVVAAVGLFGVLWVPAVGLLMEGAERVGLDHGFAFALFMLAWAAGVTVGSVGGGTLAEATGDGVPYALLAGLFGLSALWATGRARARPAAADRLPA
jgi:predicted MFS family arabinose efflux permease